MKDFENYLNIEEKKKQMKIAQCKHKGEFFYLIKCKDCKGVIGSDINLDRFEIVLIRKEIGYNINNGQS